MDQRKEENSGLPIDFRNYLISPNFTADVEVLQMKLTRRSRGGCLWSAVAAAGPRYKGAEAEQSARYESAVGRIKNDFANK